MRRTLLTHRRDLVALAALVAIAVAVGGYVLVHQRLTLPGWVPAVGRDTVTLRAELPTAKAVSPGQGQAVTIAGVPVGEIADVRLDRGRAVVALRVRRRYAAVYRDAQVVLRPKTGLEDMVLELDPGTEAAGRLPRGARIGAGHAVTPVAVDEILASLDRDTRDHLVLLLSGGGRALRGNGPALSAALRRLEPTTRDVRAIAQRLATRRASVRRVVASFSRLAAAVGEKDAQLARLVRSSERVFGALARRDGAVRATLRELPPALDETRAALDAADRLAARLGPALADLRPAARDLAPALRATRPFLRATTPVLRTQLRPFARDALPTVRTLRPAARDLAVATPRLTASTRVLDRLLNTLAHNPPGDREEGFLFWAAWANHVGASLFSNQDAHGPLRRGALLTSCDSLGVLATLTATNPVLGTLTELANVPDEKAACPAATAASSRGRGR
jgi:phospholipid/cholesterol/gamma-HCH transport system substrate-binding protein